MKDKFFVMGFKNGVCTVIETEGMELTKEAVACLVLNGQTVKVTEKHIVEIPQEDLQKALKKERLNKDICRLLSNQIKVMQSNSHLKNELESLRKLLSKTINDREDLTYNREKQLEELEAQFKANSRLLNNLIEDARFRISSKELILSTQETDLKELKKIIESKEKEIKNLRD